MCTAQWSLYVPHSGHYMYRQFNIQQFYVLPTQLYLCVLCGSENKQRLFPYTKMKDFFSIQCSPMSHRALLCRKVQTLRTFVLPATAMCRWRWVWSNGGMILTGENWNTGIKTLYSVGGRWMDEWSNGGMILTGEIWNSGTEIWPSVTLSAINVKWNDSRVVSRHSL